MKKTAKADCFIQGIVYERSHKFGGGKKKFLEKVRKNAIEWAGIFAAFRKSRIDGLSCDMCRYRDRCDHCENMISTAKTE